MRLLTALELKTRVAAPRPVAVVVSRRRSPHSDHCIKTIDAVCEGLGLQTASIDADASDHAGFLDELNVRNVPEVQLWAGGVLLDRCGGVIDATDAQRWVVATLGAVIATTTTTPPGSGA